MSISVVLVDDQAMVRAGFRMILDSADDIQVVGEATDGEEAVPLVRRERPDLVLMDVQMPRLDGLEATRQIAAELGDRAPRVIILTTFERDDYIFDALRAGAAGFLLKNSPPEQLIEAVRIVAAGDALLSPSVTARIVKEFARQPNQPSADLTLVDRLTDREREVLVEVATGKTNAEIAEALFVGEATVKTHVSNLLAKLGLRDRIQAVVFSYESGLVERRLG